LVISTNAFAAENDVLVNVNGTPITEGVFKTYVTHRLGVWPGENFPEQQKQQLLDEVIHRELIYQQAQKSGFTKKPEIANLVYDQIRNLVTTKNIQQMLNDTPIKEEQLKEVYQQQVVNKQSKEYHARHILLDSQEEANAVVNELMKGSDFVTLAKSRSTGPSGKDGGDLGWFTLNQMVKPFSDAVEKLKPGSYTQRPVKTQFGWHIVKLENVRDVDPPPMDSMTRKLTEIIQNDIINAYIEQLRDDADIEIVKK
jgi:peptidyl-prolyl cis-trans isomerase C